MRTTFQEMIRYRGLIQTLVVRDLKARYRGSTLGLLWTLLNPLFHMAIYALVFSVYIRNDMAALPGLSPLRHPAMDVVFLGALHGDDYHY